MGLDPARLFGGLDIAPDRPLIAAVSGGSDSLALLLLAAAFLKSISSPPLIAVTVDHRLRAESAAEARTVGALCGRIGIPHRIIDWDGEKPTTGLPAAAREARYRLLAQAAGEEGATIVLTGHTMEDQAETVAMRRARRDAGIGLAGMARSTLFDERIWIARPLLSIRRAALRAYLSSHGVAWADDATNDNRAFERARVRAGMEDAEIAALAAGALAEGEARRALARETARLAARHLSLPAPGLFRLGVELFGETSPAAVHLLRLVLAIAGGRSHLPDAERAGALFLRPATGEPFRVTLSRAVVEARGGAVWIRREARDVPVVPLPAQPMLWDGRWRIEAPRERCDGLFVGPLGRAAARLAGADAAGAPAGPARASASLVPWLFEGAAPVGPVAGERARGCGVSAAPVLAPFARFLPDFDLAAAAALRGLLGLGPLPAPPWRNHIDA